MRIRGSNVVEGYLCMRTHYCWDIFYAKTETVHGRNDGRLELRRAVSEAFIYINRMNPTWIPKAIATSVAWRSVLYHTTLYRKYCLLNCDAIKTFRQ